MKKTIKESTLRTLIRKELKKQLNEGTTTSNIQYSKDGYAKRITNPMTGKFVKQVKVGDVVYRYNPVYKTYNSVRGNELLYKDDEKNIQYESINEAEEDLYVLTAKYRGRSLRVNLSKPISKVKVTNMLKHLESEYNDPEVLDKYKFFEDFKIEKVKGYGV